MRGPLSRLADLAGTPHTICRRSRDGPKIDGRRLRHVFGDMRLRPRTKGPWPRCGCFELKQHANEGHESAIGSVRQSSSDRPPSRPKADPADARAARRRSAAGSAAGSGWACSGTDRSPPTWRRNSGHFSSSAAMHAAPAGGCKGHTLFQEAASRSSTTLHGKSAPFTSISGGGPQAFRRASHLHIFLVGP